MRRLIIAPIEEINITTKRWELIDFGPKFALYANRSLIAEGRT